MKLSDFQKAIMPLMRNDPTETALAHYCLGLAGETGEVIEPIKKHLYFNRILNMDNVEEELADVVWYVSAIANTLDIDLDEALQLNLEKLQKRYPNGLRGS